MNGWYGFVWIFWGFEDEVFCDVWKKIGVEGVDIFICNVLVVKNGEIVKIEWNLICEV